MKKLLLIIALFSFLGVYAGVNKAQYFFTGGNATAVYPLPVKFNMDGWVDIVIYNSGTGFVLSEATKNVNVVWKNNPGNDGMRIIINYSYEYTEGGNVISDDNASAIDWVPQIGNNKAGTFNIMDHCWAIKNDILTKEEATVTIKKIMLSNFGAPSTDYELVSLEVGGQSITNLYSDPSNGARFYNGIFSASNIGAQAFFISSFSIPEEYKGKYVRIDFTEAPADNWGLNFAYDLGDGWTNISGYSKKRDLSYYYQIPATATTMNPQLWKSSEEGTEWTIKIAGFYLVDNIEEKEYYNTSYFPLTSAGVDLNIWGTNSFDEPTKTFTFGSSFNSVGWSYSGVDFSEYDYLVINFSDAPASFIEPRIRNNNTLLVPPNNTIKELQKYVMDLKGDFRVDGGDGTFTTYTFDEVQQFYFWNSWEDANATIAIESIYLLKVFTEIRSHSTGDFGTICLPLAATVTNATVYEIAGVDNVSKPTAIYLNEVNEMQAGVPYIYKATAAGFSTAGFKAATADNDVVFTYSYSGTEPLATPATATGLVGTFEDELTIPSSAYSLNGTNLVAGDGTSSVGNYQAYLTLSTLSAVAPTLDYIDTSDIITGIKKTSISENEIVNVYTVLGVKIRSQVNKNEVVKELPSGLYIIGNKKVFIK